MRYALTRIARFVLVFVIVTFLVMLVTRIGSKDPIRDLAGGTVGDAQMQKVRDDFPYVKACSGTFEYIPCVAKQYVYWAKDMVTGNMGVSYLKSQTVVEMFQERAPSTFFLGFWAIIIGLVIAVPIGVYSAYKRDGWLDRILSLGSYVSISMPQLVLAVLLLYGVASRFEFFPNRTNYVAPWENPVEHFKNFFLPSLTLGLGLGAVWSRLLRADMILTLQSDFINLARAKGVKPARVLWVHALRSSVLSLITSVALQMSGLVSGAVVAEQFFGVPGLGFRLVEAVQTNDILAIQAITAVIVAVVVVVNVGVDLLYSVIDPRIRQMRAMG
ncbi:MAG: ABC transporter permease [Ilumatobacteraceae bacterium]